MRFLFRQVMNGIRAIDLNLTQTITLNNFNFNKNRIERNHNGTTQEENQTKQNGTVT